MASEPISNNRQQLFFKYFDLAQVMFVVIDSHQKVIFANKKTCEILQISRKEIIGLLRLFLPCARRPEPFNCEGR